MLMTAFLNWGRAGLAQHNASDTHQPPLPASETLQPPGRDPEYETPACLQPINNPLAPAMAVAMYKFSDVSRSISSPQTKKHSPAPKQLNATPAKTLVHFCGRELRRNMRQSTGTIVTATIKLDASANVFVQASGEKSR